MNLRLQRFNSNGRNRDFKIDNYSAGSLFVYSKCLYRCYIARKSKDCVKKYFLYVGPPLQCGGRSQSDSSIYLGFTFLEPIFGGRGRSLGGSKAVVDGFIKMFEPAYNYEFANVHNQ